MVSAFANTDQRLREYLLKRAPYSVLDRAGTAVESGRVLEASRSGSYVRGLVRDERDETFSVTIELLPNSGTGIPNSDTGARCTCCTPADMREQWCHHACAVLWRAHDLGFLESDGGFPTHDATVRVQPGSPTEVASVIEGLAHAPTPLREAEPYHPDVSIELYLRDDRVGLRVFFDGALQAPELFEALERQSARALDSLLLQLLEEHGSWDEEARVWYVNASDGIQLIFGIIQEYTNVLLVERASESGAPHLASDQGVHPAEFQRLPLDARLIIDWHADGAMLAAEWILPGGETLEKTQQLLGTGPYWVAIGHRVFRVSTLGARVASMFPHGRQLNFTRGFTGPILEALQDQLYDPRLVVVRHPELQPLSQVCEPSPVLEISRRESGAEHFGGNFEFELLASLVFEYPPPPADENMVNLPHREREREHAEALKALGFTQHSDKKRFSIGGESALDIVFAPKNPFPTEFKVVGLEAIRKSMKLADLKLKVRVSTPNDPRDGEEAKSGPIDWFDCHVGLTQNNANVPLSVLFKHARADSDRWIRLDCGSYARVPGGGLNTLRLTLGMLDSNFRLSNAIRSRISSAQAVSLARADDGMLQVQLDERLDALSRRLQLFEGIEPVKLSKSFTGKLRPYQQDGVNWLNFLMEFGLGGILADEMGLGKTVQALALLQSLRDQGTKTAAGKGSKRAKDRAFQRPVLVIAPTSVITNWVYESKRFTPKLSVLLLHGPDRKKLFPKIAEHDIVITSYALLRLDRFELEKHEFSVFILDEAQNIKNPQAATTKAAKAIRAHRRLALTGTPTENRPLELWSIMDFLMPGYLGSGEFFRNYIEKPILEGGPGVQVGRILNQKTRPFLLRRAKHEVERDLPPKIEAVMHVEMTTSQRQLYNEILAEVRPRVFSAVEKQGIRGASVSILAALLRLRQVCNHPNSIQFLKDAPGYDSGKFGLFKELVEEAISSGRKLLVFSQFREMLSIIRSWLDEQAISHLYLDGETRNRQEIIDQFNHDDSVRLFVISLKAGGTGLNLTAADTVVIYDPWWNPAVEGQAVDRAHRIGQTKTVNVYRLVTEESVEQKIMELKHKKSKVVEALINENGLSTLNLTKADLDNIFSPLPEL